MSEDQEKKQPLPTRTPPVTTPAPPRPSPLQTAVQPTPKPTQPVKPAEPAKGPLLSRRAFVLGALGASALLTVGAFSPSGGILGPLIPPQESPIVVANWNDLNNAYNAVANTPALYSPTTYSQFFYWPYTASQNTYYKNVIIRLPDAAGTNSLYPGDPILSKVVAYNTTCVHLQCLVNPGYSSNQFRLLCPCHGSQYELATGVPKAGPAYDLGLNPLPIIQLKADPISGKITAVGLIGTVGLGRIQ